MSIVDKGKSRAYFFDMKILILDSWGKSSFVDAQENALKAHFEVSRQSCLQTRSMIPYFVRPLLQAYGIQRATKIKPDLIHAHSAYPAGVVALHLKRLWSVPVVLTEHTGPLNLLQRYFLTAKSFPEHFKKYDSIIAVSHFQKNEIQNLTGIESIHVVGNIVDPKFLSAPLGTVAASNSGCFIGSLDENKGITSLVEVLEALDEAEVRMNFTVLGSGPLESYLKNAIKNFHYVNCEVKSFGSVQVDELLKKCSFLILTSKIETFSMVSAEALALGKAVFGLKCGGPEDFVFPPFGELFENVADLQECIRKFIKTNPQGLDIQRRDHIQGRFSQNIIVSKLKQIYEGFLKIK